MTTDNEHQKYPIAGRCYKGLHGQKVEVLAVAQHRIEIKTNADMLDRRTFIVFRHGRGPHDGWNHDAWCETWPEWAAGEWVEITREEFVGTGRMWNHRGGPWAVVVVIPKNKPAGWIPNCSSFIWVTKCHVPIDVTEAFGFDFKTVPEVILGGRYEFGAIKGGRRIKTLDGRVWAHREDARRAKKLFMAKHKIPQYSPAEMFGWDDGRDNY